MADDFWRITWMGEGVRSNEAGTFGKYTTAFVKESVARKLIGDAGWEIVDPSGNAHHAREAYAKGPPPAKPAEKPVEKPVEKPAAPKPEPPKPAAEKPSTKSVAKPGKEISLDDEDDRKELRDRAMAILADEDEDEEKDEPEAKKKS